MRQKINRSKTRQPGQKKGDCLITVLSFTTANCCRLMSTNSPNNSILTFSPLLTTKKVRDHFQTPPNPLNQQQARVHSQSHPQTLYNNSVSSTTANKNHILPLPNLYAHQSSPQDGRGISTLFHDEPIQQKGEASSNNGGLSNKSSIENNLSSLGSSNNNKDSGDSQNEGSGNGNNNSNGGGNGNNINFSGNNNNSNSKGNNNNNNNNIHNPESSTIFDINTPLTQADKLRLWRHDALLQHHYKTAIYIGDKVLSLTNDPNDAFWLAQVHYASSNYQIARNLLLGPNFEASVGCRYLAGLCLIKLEKLDEALDIIGEVNPFKKDHSIRNPDGGIKLEASMCYLRGLIYAKQNNFERARDCFKEAVLVDVKCFEAFDELISNHLLTPNEEWDLLQCLNFDDADNNNELVKMLYTTHINKYKNLNLYEDAKQRLKDEYDLGDNIDILLSEAELYFIKCKFQECLALCTKIIERDELNISAVSNYLSCLYELGGKNKLFLMAHRLAENYPNHYITWVAIGIYYFAIKQISEARLFFSKASILNPNFASAWIGFAHTFAADGEHEQAISAYATASRLFPGTHLPNLFLGMQYLQMNNYTLAWEYLNYSYAICPTDPLLLNEIGVLNYHKSELQKAEVYLCRALVASKSLEYGSKAWCSIHCNLAHVYRRMSLYDKSISHFNEVLKIAKDDVNIYSTLGLINLKLGKIANAVEYLHIALSIQPNDPMATDLLDKALDLNIRVANKKFLSESLNTPNKIKKPNFHNTISNFSEVLKSLGSGSKKDGRKLEGSIPKGKNYIDIVDDEDEIMDIESE